jgi:hypothetical protein
LALRVKSRLSAAGTTTGSLNIAGSLFLVKTSPDQPQSNGKIERWHQSLKVDSRMPVGARRRGMSRPLIDSYKALR